MKNYFRKWTVLRGIYLAAAIYVLIEGIQMNNWMVIILAGIFSLMPILNVSMCGPRGCTPPRRSYTPTQKMEEVTFEEVK